MPRIFAGQITSPNSAYKPLRMKTYRGPVAPLMGLSGLKEYPCPVARLRAKVA